MLILACDIVQCVHVSTYFLPLILYQRLKKRMFAISATVFEAECFRVYMFKKAIL